jgi:2-(1,2-epoxy-1,2-dihydrophenyl)acetyl-CoA isomerase
MGTIGSLATERSTVIESQHEGASEPELDVSRSDGTLWIRFNRPAARNAMNWPMRRQLIAELTAATVDPSVRLVVIRGDAKAFSAGGDIAEMSRGADDTADKLVAGGEIIELIANMPAPVIAAVQGHAAGAGFSIALACDLIYAADNAIFSPSFALLGLGPDLSGSYWLPRAVGLHRAKQILLAGDPLTAAEAAQLGLVAAVWPLAEFEQKLRERVNHFAGGPTRAYGVIKRVVNSSLDNALAEQIAYESSEQLTVVASEDHDEALTAFREKRAPQFRGR